MWSINFGKKNHRAKFLYQKRFRNKKSWSKRFWNREFEINVLAQNFKIKIKKLKIKLEHIKVFFKSKHIKVRGEKRWEWSCEGNDVGYNCRAWPTDPCVRGSASTARSTPPGRPQNKYRVRKWGVIREINSLAIYVHMDCRQNP